MKVRLISCSQPIKDNIIGLDDVQDLIAYCARVSNPDNQLNSKTSDKLLNYLAKHKHWSPFEMVNACIEIETTRDIARQLLRHRSMCFQEFSQRYADPVKELEFVKRECRLQDPKNRQNSIEIEGDPSLIDNQQNQDLIAEWNRKQTGVIELVKKNYQWAVEQGIAKEQARALLPEGLTVSRLYANATIRSWIHYVDLRSANGTQKEHMELAKAVGKAITEIFPLADNYINN
jgi:thymidylate synthase (FAD)